MKLLLALTIAMLTGCTSVIQHSLHDEVRTITAQISVSEYEIHVYDCSNMSFDLALLLNSAGYDARLFAYIPKDIPSGLGHVIVEVVVDGHVYYIDPTLPVGKEVVRRPSERPLFVVSPYMVAWIRNDKWRESITNDFLSHLLPKEKPE